MISRPFPRGLLLGALAAFFAVVLNSYGTSIAVPNFSFEDPAQGPGGNDNGGNGDTTAITGWTITAPASSGTNNGVYYPVGGFTSTSPLPAPADGNQLAYVFPGATGATSSITTTNSLGTITANTLYTLTVALGNRNDNLFFDTGLYTIDLLANGVSVAENTLSGSAITRGTFMDLSTSFLSTLPLVGESLTIRLSATAGTDNDEGIFDNVRLTATTVASGSVPESGNTEIMFAGAMIGLGMLRMASAQRLGARFARATFKRSPSDSSEGFRG